jgi:hypothetical protein
MENLHISKSSLQEWFHQMVKKEMHIFAPVRSGDKVDFKRVTSYDEVATDYVQTTQSAKRFAFPKTEVLFSYQKDGKEATLQEAPFPKRFSGKSVLVMQQGLHPFPAFLIGIIKINYTMPDGRK